jgi:hypothetical protein
VRARVVAIAVLAVGCDVTATFHCTGAAQCMKDGVTGYCETTTYCSFNDVNCRSGHRYDASAGDGLANQCVDPCDPASGDEDGDGIGDACDVCPISKNNVDSDGDQLGDDCDPHPNTPGDRLVLFEGFHHGLPPGWMAMGSVQQVGDDLQASDLVIVPAIGQTVITRAAVVGPPATDGMYGMGVYSPRDMAGAHVNCEIVVPFQTGSAQPASVQLVDEQAGSTVVMTAPFAFTTGTSYPITSTHAAGPFSCTAGTTPTNGTVGITITPANTGLISNLAVRWSYVLVVTSP